METHRNGVAMETHRFSLRKKKPEEWALVYTYISAEVVCVF